MLGLMVAGFEVAFHIGIAVSGILQTFGLAFTCVQLKWRGIEVVTAGVDFKVYS